MTTRRVGSHRALPKVVSLNEFLVLAIAGMIVVGITIALILSTATAVGTPNPSPLPTTTVPKQEAPK